MDFPPWPCVYVVSGGNRRVKIGYTTDMGNRITALQMASPVRLRILTTCPGDRALEARLHREFRKYRTHGEWFDLSSANLRRLLRIMAGDEALPEVQTARPKRQADPRSGRKYSKVKVTRVQPKR